MAKILIIDDRPANRQFLTTLLGYQHHELREASDGAVGLRTAREFRPDLIISDVLMPTMDGYDFVRRLREEPEIGKTPVIFSTAHYLSRESQALAEKCGVTSIIYKPCEPQTVLDIVAAALVGTLEPELAPIAAEDFDREHQTLLTNKLAEKTGRLREAHGKLTALIELSTELADERDPAELLDRYCSVAREVIGARWTLVVLMERSRERVQHLGAVGLELEDTPALRYALLKTGIFKTVISEGRTICLSDVTSTPGSLQLPNVLPRAMSLLVAPLTLRGLSYGWICLADKLGLDAFSEQDEQLAMALAAKMAVAYDNACLYSDSLKYASKLETEISEREWAEEQLRLQSAAVESAANAIIITDAKGKTIWVNPAFSQTTGYSFEEAVGKNPRLLKSGKQDPAFYKGMWDTILSGKVWRNTIINRCKDGSLNHEDLTITPILNSGREITHFVGIKQDITEKTRAEVALRASELRYRRLFESAQDGILILDAVSGQIVDLNPFLIEMLGYSKEDLVGKELWEIGSFKDIVASRDAFVELQQQGFIRYEDMPLKTKGGVLKEVEFVSNSYIAGGIRVIQCNIRDITERKVAEKALRESGEQLRLFNLATNDTFWTWDLITGQVTRSIGFERVFGYTAEEITPVIGWWEDRLHPEDHDRVLNVFQAAVAIGDETCSYEYRFRKLDSSYATIADRAYLVRDSSGKVVRAMGAMTDITERKRSEDAVKETNQQLEQTLKELRVKSEELTAMTQQLWQASKLATMGELSASIAHELNNPLATVSLRTENLLMRLPEDSEQRKPLEIIAQEVDRMATLVNNLLQFSRRSHRQVSTLDPTEEIVTSVEFVHYHLRSHNIEVIRNFADGLPTIQADRQQLRQVFLNLLTNASDAMPRGGKLTVRATSNGAADGGVAIDFTDSGEGISAENLKKIWEPFFTTKPEGKGTGLGLAICRRIVEAHGGKISIESDGIGLGTSVRIVLPATTHEVS